MSQDHPTTPAASPFAGREVIVAVCGGIAAYKVADLVSKLVQAGAGVSVCMTAEAQQFVTPVTFQALSGRPVRTGTFHLLDSSDPQHIVMTERADLMLVAPATNNIIAKAACGICDDLISTMICAAACPVVFAPSMNSRMWANRICQENVAKLKALGYAFIGPEDGWLACRSTGPGRLSEPKALIEQLAVLLPPRR
jgi:phosphopantothenoylcysteine decarboxylase/phosphopantothenate--cysteine ligase